MFSNDLVEFVITDITIELLQKCDQNCIYCSSSSSSDQNIYLTLEIVKNIIDDFNKLGGNLIELSGGEPLSYPYISEIIDYIKKYDNEIHLFTCCYLPEKKIDWNAIEKVDKIFVNLQAPNKDTHDFLTRNKGSFENVINFIKKAKNKNKWVGTHIIPLEYNIDEIDEYIKLAKYLKIDNISILRYVKQGRGKQHFLELNPDEITQLHSIITKYIDHENPSVKIGCPLDFQFIYRRKKTAKACVPGINRCVVRPDGNVIPCPAFKDLHQYVTGNVNERSFFKIWEKGEIFRMFRNFQYNKLNGFCEKCSFLRICKGRCHAQRIHKYGDLYSSPDPYCPLYIQEL